MKLDKRFFFLNRIKQAEWGKKLVLIPPKAPEQIKDLLCKNRSFLLQWKHKDKSEFTEKEMQHIYNERERADDYAKYNVKTIIVGYGKNGI